METETDLIFMGSIITVDRDCSHEIKRHTNLEKVLKSSNITLLTKVHIVKGMAFPVVMYGCELDHKEG